MHSRIVCLLKATLREMTTAAQRTWLTPLDFALLVFSNFIWGVNLVAAKLGIAEFPPVLFAATRFAVLAVVLLPMLRMFRGQMRTLLQAAIYSGALGFALMYLGFKLTDNISSMAIATQLGVPFTTLLSIWLLGERVRWRRKLGIALAFVGVAVVSFDPHALDHAFGLLLVAASQLVVAYGTIHIKRLRDISAWQLQAWIGLISAPGLLLLSLILDTGQWHAVTHATWIGWSAMLFTALASSLVAHTMMFHLIAKYPVTSVQPINVLSALFSIACGVIWFDDHLTLRILVGGGLALCGVVIVAMRDQKMVDTGT
ncbi:MAG TPA: DMT family transporter [Steroidobacteraceae bacterium]|nr:DMT family transporter [Steroidobacteraceae bacterium]